MSDPNGWVTNPPSTLVKVHDVTSRETLNGALGVVLQYSSDRGRYVVHLAVTQDQVSLKQENLTKASWMEQIVGQYQLLRHDRSLHQQLRGAYNTVQTRTGMKPEYLGGAAAVAFLAAIYALGFTRVMMVISFALLVLLVVGPDLMVGADRATIFRNAPQRCRDMIRDSIPVVGPKIAANNYLMAAFVGLIAVFFVKSMLPPGRSSAAGAAFSPPPHMPSQFAAGEASSSLKEHYYKLGFDDAKDLKPFGTSLGGDSDLLPPAGVVGENHPPPLPLDDYEDSSFAPPPPQRNPMWNYVGVLMSSAYIYRTVKKIGSDANGQIQFDLVQQNISAMEPVSMFMLGFSIYNLVKSVGAIMF